jgi:2-amino-4-hydroxy-6-hydroxymethyldihydropteridine diphosphokinase
MSTAAKLIAECTGARSIRASQLYRTPPIGGPKGQGDFLNAVMGIETALDVQQVVGQLHEVEAKLGRHRQMRWEARPIDLDVLLYGDDSLWTLDLKVPHPRMAFRSFVIKPAAEIVPEWIDPVSGLTIGQLAEVLALPRSTVLLTSDQQDWLDRVTSELPFPVSKLAGQAKTLKHSDAITLQTIPVVPNRGERLDLNEPLRHAILECHQQQRPVAGLLVTLADSKCDAEEAKAHYAAWTEALNLTQSPPHPIQFAYARCLIPPNDLSWAVHEIAASMDAMKCFVEPTGEPLM